MHNQGFSGHKNCIKIGLHVCAHQINILHIYDAGKSEKQRVQNICLVGLWAESSLKFRQN